MEKFSILYCTSLFMVDGYMMTRTIYNVIYVSTFTAKSHKLITQTCINL